MSQKDFESYESKGFFVYLFNRLFYILINTDHIYIQIK